MFFKFGNQAFKVLNHARGPDDSLTDVADHWFMDHWYIRFMIVYLQSTWSVVCKISLRKDHADMANTFFFKDVPSNLRVLWFGPREPNSTFQCSWHSLVERSMSPLLLFLNIFGVLYFMGHLASAAIEVFITFIGAFWVCLAFAWTYTTCEVKACRCILNPCSCTFNCIQVQRTGSTTRMAFEWKDLLTCGVCRNGVPCSHECFKHHMFHPSLTARFSPFFSATRGKLRSDNEWLPLLQHVRQ